MSTTSPSPTRRFLSAEWRDLVMLNYEVDPSVLERLVPKGTELDSWNGRTFISLVGFMFLRTKVLGLPIPFHRNFEEVNLRFYVKRESGGELRRGVVFIKEIVPRFAIAFIARTLYNEQYVSLPMRHRIERSPQNDARIAYEWKHAGKWNKMDVRTIGPAIMPADDAEETFIAEHYWGYTMQRDGGTLEYQVEHPRWQVQRASVVDYDVDVATLYGEQYASYMASEPSSVFAAIGSEIVVRKGVRL